MGNLSVKNTVKKPSKISFYRQVERRQKKSECSYSSVIDNLSLGQETNMTETVTFICHSLNHLSNFLHPK